VAGKRDERERHPGIESFIEILPDRRDRLVGSGVFFIDGHPPFRTALEGGDQEVIH